MSGCSCLSANMSASKTGAIWNVPHLRLPLYNKDNNVKIKIYGKLNQSKLNQVILVFARSSTVFTDDSAFFSSG